MRLSKGPGRLIKLITVAVLAQKVFARCSFGTMFVLVFVAVFVADYLQFPLKFDNLVLGDAFAGLALFAGIGFMCYALDFGLSLYTGRHGGPAVSAVLLAFIKSAWPKSRFLGVKG